MKLAILTLVFCVAHLVANAKNNFKKDIKPWTIPKDKNRCTDIDMRRCVKRFQKDNGNDLTKQEKWQLKNWLKDTWCEVPRKIANGKVKYRCGCGFGQMAKYRCKDGFVLVPKECKKRFCQWNRNWSGNDPICKADCGPLTAPPNGNVDFLDTLQGTMATYTCDENYALSGSKTRVCGQDHKWTGTPAVCNRITCEKLDDPTDGSVSMSGTSVTSTATYNCADNYHLDGPNTRVCLKSGAWSGTEPTCEPFDCGLLEDPCHGNAVADDGWTTLNYTVTYTCNAGYLLKGASAPRRCTKDGWDGSQPCCVKDVCTQQPCQNNGICTTEDDGGYTCSCKPGYNGTNCGENVCDAKPCKNEGTCSFDADGVYLCNCKPGYTGNDCEETVCDAKPCKNEGTCSFDANGVYSCACKPGYSGNDCVETVCDAKPCKNEGTCSFGANGVYSCGCKPGYSGNDCEESVCDPNPCQNGGTCNIGDDGAPICTCKTDTSGTNCEQKKCPAGWKPYKSSCHLIPNYQTQKLSWEDAEDYCKGKGGHLVKIDDQDEMNYLSNLLRLNNVKPWIGLNDKEVDGSFVWVSDNSAVDYANWAVGDPNNQYGEQHCVLIWTSDHKWADAQCWWKRRPLCEKPV